MARRPRKRTDALIADSQAQTASVRAIVGVLQAWHPTSMSLAIVTQQLHAFTGELATTDTGPEVALPLDETERVKGA